MCCAPAVFMLFLRWFPAKECVGLFFESFWWRVCVCECCALFNNIRCCHVTSAHFHILYLVGSYLSPRPSISTDFLVCFAKWNYRCQTRRKPYHSFVSPSNQNLNAMERRNKPLYLLLVCAYNKDLKDVPIVWKMECYNPVLFSLSQKLRKRQTRR